MEKLLVNSSFNIFGLEIQIYGLLMAIAFIVGMIVALYFCKIRGYKKDLILNLILVVLPSSIIGARLYFIIFSGRSWAFLEMLQVWNGGLAIYGGIIGAVIGIIIYCLITKESIIKVFDMLAPALLVGQSIGRIGCYFAGCCYGEVVTNPSLQWFPFAIYKEVGGEFAWRYSTFFYESLWCLIGFIVLFFLFRKIKVKGLYAGLYFIWYGLGRFLIEGIRGDSLKLGTDARVSQLLSAVLIILGVIWLIIFLTKDRKSKTVKKE